MARHPDTRPSDSWQAVTNKHWPSPELARTLRDVPADRQIKVVARVVFEDDGEQLLDGTAVRWTRNHVCVWLNDPRLQVAYVWLAPTDVRRAT